MAGKEKGGVRGKQTVTRCREDRSGRSLSGSIPRHRWRRERTLLAKWGVVVSVAH